LRLQLLNPDDQRQAHVGGWVYAQSDYTGWDSEGHFGVKMPEVDRHLNETYFAWMGATGRTDPSTCAPQDNGADRHRSAEQPYWTGAIAG
jgi:hypothetical protein